MKEWIKKIKATTNDNIQLILIAEIERLELKYHLEWQEKSKCVSYVIRLKIKLANLEKINRRINNVK